MHRLPSLRGIAIHDGRIDGDMQLLGIKSAIGATRHIDKMARQQIRQGSLHRRENAVPGLSAQFRVKAIIQDHIFLTRGLVVRPA